MINSDTLLNLAGERFYLLIGNDGKDWLEWTERSGPIGDLMPHCGDTFNPPEAYRYGRVVRVPGGRYVSSPHRSLVYLTYFRFRPDVRWTEADISSERKFLQLDKSPTPARIANTSALRDTIEAEIQGYLHQMDGVLRNIGCVLRVLLAELSISGDEIDLTLPSLYITSLFRGLCLGEHYGESPRPELWTKEIQEAFEPVSELLLVQFVGMTEYINQRDAILSGLAPLDRRRAIIDMILSSILTGVSTEELLEANLANKPGHPVEWPEKDTVRWALPLIEKHKGGGRGWKKKVTGIIIGKHGDAFEKRKGFAASPEKRIIQNHLRRMPEWQTVK